MRDIILNSQGRLAQRESIHFFIQQSKYDPASRWDFFCAVAEKCVTLTFQITLTAKNAIYWKEIKAQTFTLSLNERDKVAQTNSYYDKLHLERWM